MPDNLVEDLNRYKDWFRLADDDFDEKQDEYYLAVGLDRQPLYPHKPHLLSSEQRLVT